MSSGTIEAIHNKIIDKFKLIKESLDLLAPCINKLPNRPKYIYINLLSDEIEKLEEQYRISTVRILTDYYSSGNNLCASIEEQYTRSYYLMITSENYASAFNDIIIRIIGICDKIEIEFFAQLEINKDYKKTFDKIHQKISNASSFDISVTIEKPNYDICKCGMKMSVNPKTSQLCCELCGKTKILYGTVFEDNQFYNQEGQKTKHGSYDPNRHFKFWMDRIQAKENKTFPKAHLEEIETIIRRDGYVMVDITCDLMRKFLKESHLSCYNDHVPLLVKLITGKIPPQLTFNENRVFAMKFNKIMTIYHTIVAVTEDKKGNRPYYPYFIRKIAEQEFACNTEKLKILDYIHLQSGDTVTRHDKIYEIICKNADPEDDLVYEPTDYSDRRI
jgi:hypothetical protein